MKAKLKALLKSLYIGKITNHEFLQKYFDHEIPSTEYVEKLLANAIELKNADLVEEGIVLLYTDSFNIVETVQSLCKLLKETWHTKHEDIVMLLANVKDPKTVDCIYEVAIMELDYLAYDKTYQLARKCIKVLYAIGNERSIAKLKLLSVNKVPLIASYAQKEIFRKR